MEELGFRFLIIEAILPSIIPPITLLLPTVGRMGANEGSVPSRS
jgi:hypothetical protein